VGIDVVVAFFVLGAVSVLIRSPINFPEGLYQGLSLFLMLAIGLKGGVALADHFTANVLLQSAGVLTLGLVIPIIAFLILRGVGNFDRINAGSIAAHYGSVSVGTYAVAMSVLQSMNISYEEYFPMFVVLLEMPAILVGLWLANLGAGELNKKALLHEMTCNQGVTLMLGGLIIGAMAGHEGTESIMPLFKTLFSGALALFLLEMGIVAAKRARDIGNRLMFLLPFGMTMPVIGAVLGMWMGDVLHFSQGGVVLLTVLAASCSYIAVPAVMRAALPTADHGMAIATSLAITFPFNVIVGIPMYIWFIQRLHLG
jgi:hypothetical protein